MSNAFRDGILAGRHAFITGGTSGIGMEVARRLRQAGAYVSVLGRSQEKIEAAIISIGDGSRGFRADVRQYEAVSDALAQARTEFGEIDVLICGAAGNFPAPALGMSANGFKAVIDIDVLGTFNTCRAGFDHLRKPGACVLNISAGQAFRAMPLQSHVCAAKAGVDMLTRTLAIEWGPLGVRVNSVTPGAVDGTEGVRRLVPDEKARETLLSHIPLRRMATKGDVADLCLFMCSDAATYITGAVVVCDGGLSLA